MCVYIKLYICNLILHRVVRALSKINGISVGSLILANILD
jgi:hypothetical protein